MPVKNGIIIPEEIAANLTAFQMEQAFNCASQEEANAYLSNVLTNGHFEPVTVATPKETEAPQESSQEAPEVPEEPKSRFESFRSSLARFLPDGDLYEQGRGVVIFLTVVSLAYIAYHYVENSTGRNAVPPYLLNAYDRMVREQKVSELRYEAAKSCHSLRRAGGSCVID